MNQAEDLLILSGICKNVRTQCPFFALPITAAIGFKIFSKAVLRVKSLPTPGLNDSKSL